jgi:hypothetical protein
VRIKSSRAPLGTLGSLHEGALQPHPESIWSACKPSTSTVSTASHRQLCMRVWLSAVWHPVTDPQKAPGFLCQQKGTGVGPAGSGVPCALDQDSVSHLSVSWAQQQEGDFVLTCVSEPCLPPSWTRRWLRLPPCLLKVTSGSKVEAMSSSVATSLPRAEEKAGSPCSE